MSFEKRGSAAVVALNEDLKGAAADVGPKENLGGSTAGVTPKENLGGSLLAGGLIPNEKQAGVSGATSFSDSGFGSSSFVSLGLGNEN